MKTTGTPCELFLGQKGPRFPMSQIINYCSVLHHHLHQKEEGGEKFSRTRRSFISLLIPLFFACALWDSGHQSQHARLRCALPTEWSHNGVHDSTIDDFVILFEFQFTSQDSI